MVGMSTWWAYCLLLAAFLGSSSGGWTETGRRYYEVDNPMVLIQTGDDKVDMECRTNENGRIIFVTDVKYHGCSIEEVDVEFKTNSTDRICLWRQEIEEDVALLNQTLGAAALRGANLSDADRNKAMAALKFNADYIDFLADVAAGRKMMPQSNHQGFLKTEFNNELNATRTHGREPDRWKPEFRPTGTANETNYDFVRFWVETNECANMEIKTKPSDHWASPPKQYFHYDAKLSLLFGSDCLNSTGFKDQTKDLLRLFQPIVDRVSKNLEEFFHQRFANATISIGGRLGLADVVASAKSQVTGIVYGSGGYNRVVPAAEIADKFYRHINDTYGSMNVTGNTTVREILDEMIQGYNNNINRSDVGHSAGVPIKIKRDYDLVCEYKGETMVQASVYVEKRTHHVDVKLKVDLKLEVWRNSAWVTPTSVLLGERIRISFKNVAVGIHAAFHTVDIVSDGGDSASIITAENCFRDPYKSVLQGTTQAVTASNGVYSNGHFEMIAFQWAGNSQATNKGLLTIKCVVSLCHELLLKKDFGANKCTRGCQSRRKRSLEESTESVSIRFQVEHRRSCSSPPSVAHGTTTPNDGLNVGSKATVRCDQGFDLKGPATLECEESVVKESELIVYETRTDWTPREKTSCEDVNECSQNPCATSFECVNAVGSYACRCPRGRMESAGVCSIKSSFNGRALSKKLAYSPKWDDTQSDEYKATVATVQAELKNLFRLILDASLSVEVLSLKEGTTISFKVNVVKTVRNSVLGMKGLMDEVKASLRIANSLAIDLDSIQISQFPYCSLYNENDCHIHARCKEELLSFTCDCKPGYKDLGDPNKPGRYCEATSESVPNKDDDGKDHASKWSNSLVIGLGVLVGVLALIIVFIVGALLVRRRRVIPEDQQTLST